MTSSSPRIRIVAFALAVALALIARSAHGEPVRILTPSHVITQGGSEIDLPPGVFFDENQYDTLELEVKRLQEAETRLSAENKSLRESAKTSWSTWVWVTLAGAASAYTTWKLTD